ncbi:MAG TPA: hypothetical protein DD420_13600, partial [Streptomyces sp.]|nr:hypothetical protein [Streptomyces sp.]
MALNFDALQPWAGMRRCNLADDGTVLAYWGDAAFKDDGSNGQVMVEIPRFFYRTVAGPTGYQWYISPYPTPGYKVHPAFVRAGVGVPKIYAGAYKASCFDVSEGAYNLTDAPVIDFTAGTGDKMASIAGAKPISGFENDLTIVKSRILAQNRGPGWGQIDFLTANAVNMLLLVELGHFDAQTKIGRGIVDKAIGTGNEAELTGQTAALGNQSGAATGNLHNSISYRGLEDWWGNIWEWTDGINIRNWEPFVADHDYVSNKFDGHYKPLGITLPSEDGYVADIAVSDDYDWGFLPSEVGASATTKLCDYYCQNTGNRAARRGGYWHGGSFAGPFYWLLYSTSSYRYQYLGARLLYV